MFIGSHASHVTWRTKISGGSRKSLDQSQDVLLCLHIAGWSGRNVFKVYMKQERIWFSCCLYTKDQTLKHLCCGWEGSSQQWTQNLCYESGSSCDPNDVCSDHFLDQCLRNFTQHVPDEGVRDCFWLVCGLPESNKTQKQFPFLNICAKKNAQFKGINGKSDSSWEGTSARHLSLLYKSWTLEGLCQVREEKRKKGWRDLMLQHEQRNVYGWRSVKLPEIEQLCL